MMGPCMCTRCFKDNKDGTKVMSKENNMDPETDITALEECADEHGALPTFPRWRRRS